MRNERRNFRHTPAKNGAARNGLKMAQSNGYVSRRDMAIINRIVKEFSGRSRVDIDKWRESIREAENDRFPKRVKWGRISRDLDLDAHWSSQILIRKLSVLCKQFKIVDKKTGAQIEEKTKLFKAPWFYRYLSIALDAKFFGSQVVEIEDLIFGNYNKDGIWQVPVTNIVPDKKEILLTVSSQNGYYYGEDDYMVQIDEDVFMGLLSKAAPHIIWKKNALQSWAEFCEKFGIPLRYATTNKKDQQTIDRIEKMLDSLGSAAKAIFPEGTTLDFKEANTTDSFNVFDKMIDRCNSEISKLINGATMLSDNGSSLSQSKVHLEVNKYIVTADSQSLASDVNWNLFPKLNKLRFQIDPLKEEFQWDETETLSKKEQWMIISGILKFYEIDEEWIAEQFSVPISGKRTTPVNESSASQPDVTNLLARLQGGEKITNEELTEFLISFLSPSFKNGQPQPASVGPSFSIAGYNTLLNTCSHEHVYAHKLPEVEMSAINSLFLKAAEKFFENKKHKPAALRDDEWNALYKFIADKFWKNTQDGYGKVEADLTTVDEDLLKKLRENMYMFSAAKNFQLLQTLNANLLDENGKLREWSDFKSLALQANKQYNVTWLETEYNTAIASAQSAARWQQLYDERDQFDLLYHIIDDENNSEICESLKNTVASPSDAIVKIITPPNHWACRSEWLQIPKGSRAKSSSVDSSAIPNMFRHNVGETGQVFTEDHPYWNGTSSTDRKQLKDLAKDTIKDIDNEKE